MCAIVNAELQKLYASEAAAAGSTEPCPEAIVVGMDGWHYSRAQLAKFPDPQEAKDRRGAAFTFDARAFADFVEQLKAAEGASTTAPADAAVLAPSFSHSLKDPVADDIRIEPRHRVVIFEGLYCNCDDGEWARGARALDERWVVDVDRSVARERLRVRHVATGVAKDEEEALWRGEYAPALGRVDTADIAPLPSQADNNDLPNGDYLMSHLLEPVTRITSIDERTWA